jgi:hypothetical protein
VDEKLHTLIASGHLSASAPAAGRTSVPIKIVGNTMVVSVTINSSQQAFLVVDTGSVKTILSPALMDRLRIAIPLNAPRWTVRLVGGATAAMPFVRVRSDRFPVARSPAGAGSGAPMTASPWAAKP